MNGLVYGWAIVIISFLGIFKPNTKDKLRKKASITILTFEMLGCIMMIYGLVMIAENLQVK